MAQGPDSTTTNSLSLAIFELGRAHRAHASELLRRLGLHPGWELLLMRLFEDDGQPQSRLLQSVGLDASTVSKSLTRMQQAGLLVREPSPQDRRVQLVHLTPTGRAMREPLQEMWSELERISTYGLSTADTETFIRTAHTIASSLRRRSRQA